MIKNFDTYINEDYFSKLANRMDNQELRKEQSAVDAEYFYINDSSNEGDELCDALENLTYKGSISINDFYSDNGIILCKIETSESLNKILDLIVKEYCKVTGNFAESFIRKKFNIVESDDFLDRISSSYEMDEDVFNDYQNAIKKFGVTACIYTKLYT